MQIKIKNSKYSKTRYTIIQTIRNLSKLSAKENFRYISSSKDFFEPFINIMVLGYEFYKKYNFWIVVWVVIKM